MRDIDLLIQGLASTPEILENLLADIPVEKLKQERIKNKWTIHEHVCHIAQAEEMIYNRFNEFNQKVTPQFNAYLPGKTVETSGFIYLDAKDELEHFKTERAKTLHLIKNFSLDMWERKACHEEYREYGAYILLRHVLMHDFFHMYRIEEMWLTKDEFLIK